MDPDQLRLGLDAVREDDYLAEEPSAVPVKPRSPSERRQRRIDGELSRKTIEDHRVGGGWGAGTGRAARRRALHVDVEFEFPPAGTTKHVPAPRHRSPAPAKRRGARTHQVK